MFLLLLTIYNEIRKSCLIMWEYRLDLLSSLLFYIVIFLAVSYFRGNGALKSDVMLFIASGYTIWYYANIVIGAAGTSIAEEAGSGTLEKIFISPVRFETFLCARMISALCIGSINVILLCILLSFFVDIRGLFDWKVFPIILLTLFGVLGFSLLIASVALVYKRVSGFINVLRNALMFLNGTFFAVDGFPPWLKTISNWLPTTQGIRLTRALVLENQSLPGLLAQSSFYTFFLQSVLYLLVGLLALKIGERYARIHGLLGQY